MHRVEPGYLVSLTRVRRHQGSVDPLGLSTLSPPSSDPGWAPSLPPPAPVEPGHPPRVHHLLSPDPYPVAFMESARAPGEGKPQTAYPPNARSHPVETPAQGGPR